MSGFWNELWRDWLGNMTTDVQRYVIFAVSVWLILYVVLGLALKRRRIHAKHASWRQMGVEFLHSVRSVAIFSTIALSLIVLGKAGLMPLPKLARSLGPVWFWFSLAMMVLAHDAYFYWVHRLMHRPGWYRSLHQRHHRSHITTPFTAYSFDLGEAALMAVFVPLWMLVFPTPYAALPLFMIHQIFRNTLLHAGFELMPARANGRPLFDFLTTATHHNQHHLRASWNHGLYFTWWDRWMGTENPDYHAAFARTAARLPGRRRAEDATAPT